MAVVKSGRDRRGEAEDLALLGRHWTGASGLPAAGTWTLTVQELPGVIMQACQRGEVQTMARDRIAIELETPADSFDVLITDCG